MPPSLDRQALSPVRRICWCGQRRHPCRRPIRTPPPHGRRSVTRITMSKPTPHQPPVPRPVPGPGAQRRAAAAPVAAPIRSDADRADAVAAATAHGRVDDDLRVFVVTADGEREVGQYPDAAPQEALEYFAGRYIDVVDQADLLDQRLTAGADAAQVRSSRSE